MTGRPFTNATIMSLAAAAMQLATFVAVVPAAAQGSSQGSPQGAPAEATPSTRPSSPQPDGTPGGTAPAAPSAPAPNPAGPGAGAPPASGAPQQPAAAGLPTLVPGPTDSGNIDQVVLPSKPVAMMTGKSSWDDGFKTIFDSFKTINAELAKAGLHAAGRPLAVFVTTDDNGFTFNAMVPIDATPAGKTELTPTIKFGTTPLGKALRFTHRAPYDDIDNTYEAITAYLDAKDIAVKDSFIEEYGTDPKDPSDPDLQINIFVQPTE